MQSPDLPWKTSLLCGRIDVGDVGIRIVGVAWLVIAVLMLTVAAGMALQARQAQALVLIPVVASLALCVLELPHARIGLALNIVLLLFLTAHPTMGAGAMRWNHGTSDTVGRLVSSTREPVERFTSVSVVALPAPVVRYFTHVLKEGQPLVASAQFTQTGQFRMSEASDSWRPFDARWPRWWTMARAQRWSSPSRRTATCHKCSPPGGCARWTAAFIATPWVVECSEYAEYPRDAHSNVLRGVVAAAGRQVHILEGPNCCRT